MAVRWCVFKKNTGTTRRFQESYFVNLYPPIRIDPRFCFIAKFYFDELLEKYRPRRTLQILIHRPSNVAGVILDPTIFLLYPVFINACKIILSTCSEFYYLFSPLSECNTIQSAWGRLQKNGSSFHMANYELVSFKERVFFSLCIFGIYWSPPIGSALC